jgi:hypothetical protein
MGELAVEPPPRPEQKIFDGRRKSDAEKTDNMLLLLEENARLRSLVVELSTMVLKNIADQR